MRVSRLIALLFLPFAASVLAQPAPLPTTLTLQTLNAGQTLPGAVGVRHANDGSNRLFVIVRTGQIRIMSTAGAVVATPFLSFQANPPTLGFAAISDPEGGDERGLLGLAFHPLYATNRKFYVYYLDGNSNSVVTEYTASSADANVADPASARVILRVYQPFTNHNGGDIHFGSDGYLYVGLGDGGSGNDPCNSGQSLTTATMSGCVPNAAFTGTAPAGVPVGQATARALLGKMLRIDVDSTDTPDGADLCGADPALRRYGIPADNPFAGDAGSNAAACDEIFHYGLRNPFRFSFDRDTHDLIIGDVGQSTFEEVDLVPPAGGVNFGWKVCEGFNQRGSTSTDCPLAGATDPILTYGRSLGVSITGGFRYRGPYAQLDGVYFFADAYFQNLFFARESAGTWQRATWRTGQGVIAGFGEDEAGQLYLTTLEGLVKRFAIPAALVVQKAATLVEDGGTAGVADAGDEIDYVVTLQNSGDADLSGIDVLDVLNGAPAVTLDCPATLASLASADCATYTHVVTQADVDSGAALVNNVQAEADAPGGVVATASASASIAVVAAQPVLTLALTKTLVDADGDGAADVGDTIEYAYAATNDGNVSVEDLVVTSERFGALTCAPAVLAPDAVASCGTRSLVVTQLEVDAGEALVEEVEASAASLRDGATLTSQATDTTPVAAAAPAIALSVAFTLSNDVDGDTRVDVGDTVRSVFSVSNEGNVTLSNATVDSSLDGVAACSLDAVAPAQTVDCGPVDRVVLAGDVEAGLVALTATARGTPSGGGGAVVSEEISASLVADRPVGIFADGFEDQ